MMMMAFLSQTNLILEPQNLLSVLAHLAVHQSATFNNFIDAFLECLKHERMIVQISGFNELNVRIASSNFVSE